MDESRAFWVGAGSDGKRRIGDYGLIGDSETAALVSRYGSIDWLCWPRFDSEASVAALLGDERNGYWRIAPRSGSAATSRSYRGDSLVLESLFETEGGSVLLIDLMPLRGRASDIVRMVVCRSGRISMRSVLDLRFEYGQLRPLVDRVDEHEVSALAGPHAVVLRSDRRLDIEGSAVTSDFELGEGERASFVLTYFPSHLSPGAAVDPDRALQETERYWSDWTGRCTYQGPHRDMVVRSLVTLKALTYGPTGGTVAAPTTSLPELFGGERNWDYRYCWLRDAAFMLLAFVHGGYPEEAKAWRDWLIRAVAGEHCSVRPLYEVDGGQGIFERELSWLDGFNGSRPVRIGNAAHDQLQLDVFGEVIDALSLARKHGVPEHERSFHLQRSLLDVLETRWQEPDAGIWEIRAPPRHFVHSKALAWAAFDRGARHLGAGDPRCERWASIRDEIRRQILDRGFNARRNAFRRDYDSDALDASTLLLPMIGLVDPNDPRAIGTTEAIERDLTQDGLVLRYRTEEATDGLPPGEGAFLACSFWLADNYLLQHRRGDAETMFERLVGQANDLGLLSEECDPRTGTMLGNFPQALSHVALVNTAYNLSEAEGPAEDRLSGGG